MKDKTELFRGKGRKKKTKYSRNIELESEIFSTVKNKAVQLNH